jgi:hypothetical protein
MSDENVAVADPIGHVWTHNLCRERGDGQRRRVQSLQMISILATITAGPPDADTLNNSGNPGRLCIGFTSQLIATLRLRSR